MATEDEILKDDETEIREKAERFRTAMDAHEKAEAVLTKAVNDYRKKRENLQREDFAKKGLGWCQGCSKAYLETSIVLLYTEGIESHGSEYSEYNAFERRLQSICKECAKIGLSQPRGGESRFQCYEAEKRDGEFFIFVSGRWRPIEKPEEVTINIEQEDISKEDYVFGKDIDYESSPFKLTIGEEEVV